MGYETLYLIGFYLLCSLGCFVALLQRPFTRDEILVSGIGGLLWPVVLVARFFVRVLKG